jgi:hypothetical protein
VLFEEEAVTVFSGDPFSGDGACQPRTLAAAYDTMLADSD